MWLKMPRILHRARVAKNSVAKVARNSMAKSGQNYVGEVAENSGRIGRHSA
jgi:hypothetical protein